MNIDPRSIALFGIGLGVMAVAGFGLADAPDQTPAPSIAGSDGGGSGLEYVYAERTTRQLKRIRAEEALLLHLPYLM